MSVRNRVTTWLKAKALPIDATGVHVNVQEVTPNDCNVEVVVAAKKTNVAGSPCTVITVRQADYADPYCYFWIAHAPPTSKNKVHFVDQVKARVVVCHYADTLDSAKIAKAHFSEKNQANSETMQLCDQLVAEAKERPVGLDYRFLTSERARQLMELILTASSSAEWKTITADA